MKRSVLAVALLCLLGSACAQPVTGAARPIGPVTKVATATDPSVWTAWAFHDRASGSWSGSANSATERTEAESTIKAWIGVDVLRLRATRGPAVTPDELRLISAAVRQSDDQAAETLYRSAGGDEVLRDLQPVCEVAVTTSRQHYWSFAQVSAVEAARIMECVLDEAPRRPGGAELVADLRSVDADGAFGIPDALPAGTRVAVKNGWTEHSARGIWNVNCVASWDAGTLAVLTRYPRERGRDFGAALCRDVTARVLAARSIR
ncbi:hypothetical protein ACQEVB_17785 [Pseudonocardia sp. CA-107938]|uniref:hypothetical protein n=1 Tax=Pseudonocardia sp. CA-107938 TaxID=3240021 RepID=UPI003D89F8ED